MKGKIDVNFDYYNLKKASESGMKLGNWNGGSVFAASKDGLNHLGSGAYYVVYDDNNVIVRLTSDGWYAYGKVKESGTVVEYDSRKKYFLNTTTSTTTVTSEKKASKVPSVSEGTYVPGYSVEEPVIADVALEKLVEDTLALGRNQSVDDMLKGFHYGTDDFCVHGEAPQRGYAHRPSGR